MQFRRVVVGVDFSEASLTAARWVATHFAPEAEIVLVHVLPEPRVPSYLRAELPPAIDIAATMAPSLYGGLHGLAELVGGDRARIDILIGNPPDALARAAAEEGADLICVGRGRRRRGSARFGATTAQRLLARTRVPTVVVPATRPGASSHIIAAVDERVGGRAVLEVACGLAAAAEARLEALHVVEAEVQAFVSAAREALAPHDLPPGEGAAAPALDAGAPLRAGSVRERALAWLHSMLWDVTGGAGRVSAALGAGDPAEEIIRRAHEGDADLIVIGRGGDASHESAPAGALPLGSTTRFVLWTAPCPALVLPLDPSRALTAPSPERGARHQRETVEPAVIELRGSPREHAGPLPPAARQEQAQGGAA
ncbi:MAG TPA: universal stress protein [Gemmatimonadaceae bacterium]|nr:universal stress protein [Gemmatimonadaceae bacterium]